MPQRHRDFLYEEFKDGNIPDQNAFADIFDSGINFLDDGITILKTDTPTGQLKHVGINQPNPDCLLSIKGDSVNNDTMICFESTDETQEWNINLNPTSGNVKGFSIDNSTSGTSVSNLFIDVNTGNVGINSVAPADKLHVFGNVDGGAVSALITNVQTGLDGWGLSVMDDNAVTDRVGAFSVRQKSGSSYMERITVLPEKITAINTYHFTGINTVLPYAPLHVGRPDADTQTNIALNENTGIILSGSMIGHNLALDNHQIQSRFGDYVAGSTTIQLTSSVLNIQPLGGGTVFNNSFATSQRVTIDDNGNVGFGTTPSTERINLAGTSGAVTFGPSFSNTPAEGTVRWFVAQGSAGDLQVYRSGTWLSLIKAVVTDGLWTEGPAGSGIIYYDTVAGNPKVGIGLTTPTATLQVDVNEDGASSDSYTAIFSNESVGATGTTHTRAAVNIHNTSTWSSSGNAANIGLYVSEVSGQTNANGNMAAVLNGNVVIGNVNGLPLVGAGGTNVLAIQTGVTPPTTIPGSTPNSGVQLFSAEIPLGPVPGIDTSVLHVMTGDGNTILLYQQPKLQPDASANDPSTGDNDTNLLIINMRERINALEQVLKNLYLLPNP